MQTYLNKIAQVCKEIRNIKINNYIAVRNPTAWANGTTPEAVLDKTTNKIITPGNHNQDNNLYPEDNGGACGQGCTLSEDNSAASQTCTHNNPGCHDGWHHAPS